MSDSEVIIHKLFTVYCKSSPVLSHCKTFLIYFLFEYSSI